jgi:hypothetical protein
MNARVACGMVDAADLEPPVGEADEAEAAAGEDERA